MTGDTGQGADNQEITDSGSVERRKYAEKEAQEAAKQLAERADLNSLAGQLAALSREDRRVLLAMLRCDGDRDADPESS